MSAEFDPAEDLIFRLGIMPHMNIIHSYIKTPFLVPMVHDSRENKGIERASIHKIAFSCSDGAEDFGEQRCINKRMLVEMMGIGHKVFDKRSTDDISKGWT